jgi:hypothetical protein
MFVFPKCRHCGRKWHPQEGAVASRNYCEACHRDRREFAKRKFSLRPLSVTDFNGRYLLPRALRSKVNNV